MDHKELDLWKAGVGFVTVVYDLTRKFPDSEKFGLISQLRRASVSIPANVSEGAARNSDKEFIHFLYVALGSASEVETLLHISGNLNYMDSEQLTKLSGDLERLKKLTLGLIKYLKNKTA
jgi:four helix bundle protein